MSIGNHVALLTAALVIAWAFSVEGALFSMFLMGYSTGYSVADDVT